MKTADESPRLPSRRAFLALGVGAFVIGAAPLARRRQRALIRRTLPVMGTIAELGVVHRDARFAHGALDAAVAELVRVEQSMSRFLADSDIGRVNRVTAGQPVHVAQSTAAVLAAALHYARGRMVASTRVSATLSSSGT